MSSRPSQAAVVLPVAEGESAPCVRFRTGHNRTAVASLLCPDCQERLSGPCPSLAGETETSIRTLEMGAVPPLPELFRGLATRPSLLCDLFGGSVHTAGYPLQESKLFRIASNRSSSDTQ
jgi:hypothetical protein